MRNIARIIIALMINHGFSVAQTVDPRIDDNAGMMRQVLELEGYSMKQIHDAAELWIKQNYRNPNEVIMVNDSNYIRVNEHVDLPNISSNVVDCYVATEWDFKDGKLRLTTTDYNCKSQYSDFNALVSMRNKNGNVKMGYSAHHSWVVDSFNKKARGLHDLLQNGLQRDDDW